MALNIAVPLSGVDMLGENFNLISPISLQSSANASPNNFDCRATTKVLCSPIDSESSGISSLDSEEIKKSSISSTPTDDEPGSSDPPSLITSDLTSEQKSHLLSPKPKHATPTTTTEPQTLEEADDDNVDDDDDAKKTEEENNNQNERSNESATKTTFEEKQTLYTQFSKQVLVNGRNILELGANLFGTPSPGGFEWHQQGFLRFAHLPQNNNLKMFLENRSQYHRLGANGHLQEYSLVDCKCCDFTYPMNGYTATPNTSACSNILKSVSEMVPSAFAQQQQPPQPRASRQNIDHFMFNNNLSAALNRSNYNSNNILENIAVALLNSTTNNNAAYPNNTHHYQQHVGGASSGNHHYGTKNNYNTSHSYNNNSYKQF